MTVTLLTSSQSAWMRIIGQKVSPVHSMRTLAQLLLDSYIYMVIQPQEGESRQRIC